MDVLKHDGIEVKDYPEIESLEINGVTYPYIVFERLGINGFKNGSIFRIINRANNSVGHDGHAYLTLEEVPKESLAVPAPVNEPRIRIRPEDLAPTPNLEPLPGRPEPPDLGRRSEFEWRTDTPITRTDEETISETNIHISSQRMLEVAEALLEEERHERERQLREEENL